MIAKLILFGLFIFTTLLFLQLRNRFMTPNKFKFLALGDSYTIGEGVAAADNFPNQLISILNEDGFMFSHPDILAKTGWTVQELLEAIKTTELGEKYDFVTLLIGVNNQYRGLSIKEYEEKFSVVLKIAIRFAADAPNNVFVLGIPDWGKTPFAAERDVDVIAREIGAYNELNKKIAESFGVNFIAHEEMLNPKHLAADGLHPAGASYRIWAELLELRIKSLIA